MKTSQEIQVQKEINWEKEVGTINFKGNSIKAIRNAREVLSKEKRY